MSIDQIGQAAADLSLKRVAVELELLGWIAADPGTLVEVAEREGIDRSAFDGEDMILLWIAMETARGCNREMLIRIICKTLKQFTFWNEDKAVKLGPTWNAVSVQALVDGYFPSASQVKHLSKWLLKIGQRQRDAAEHLRHAAKLLEVE